MGDSLLSIAVLPVVLLLWFIYKKDPHPEPRKVLSKVFLFGCLTAIPVIICEIIADIILESVDTSTYGNLFLYVFFGVGLIEEFFKWGVVRLLCFKNKEFDETYDAIVYAAFSSLGFACVENILYVVEGGIGVGIGRALLSVPGHACFGIAMGYFFGLAKKAQSEGRNSSGLQFVALLVPSLLHTVYDFFLEMDTELGLEILVWLMFVIIMFVISLVCVLSSSKNSVYFGAGVAQQPIANNNVGANGNLQTVVRPDNLQQGQQMQGTQVVQTGQMLQNAPLVQSPQSVRPIQSSVQSMGQIIQPVQPIQAVQPVQQNQLVQAMQPTQESAQSAQSVQPVLSVQSAQAVTPQLEQSVLTQSIQQVQVMQENQLVQQQQQVMQEDQPVQQQQQNNNQI